MHALNIFLFGGLGLLVGLWHFGSLQWLSRRLLSSSRPNWRILIALQLLRIAVLVLTCWWAVSHGAWPLLAMALGILAARVVLLRQVRHADQNPIQT
jgi:F1F0 ATPase subunit 2